MVRTVHLARSRAYVRSWLHAHTLAAHALVGNSTLPLEEEGERAEEGGGEHEAVGDEDADVHAVVQRQLDEDLQRREHELHRHHGHRRLRAVHHPHATSIPLRRAPKCKGEQDHQVDETWTTPSKQSRAEQLAGCASTI